MIRLGRVARQVGLGLVILLGAWNLAHLLPGYLFVVPERLFIDADLYWNATAAWLAGESPWQVVSDTGVRFAGWPPTLLLNLPLQPFGVGVARPFWAIAGLVGMLYAMRRLGLPWYFLLWAPFFRGYLAGSPDPALFGLAALGLGWVAALTKPYTVPALLGTGRARAVVIAGIVAVASLPLLPWGRFIAERDTIAGTITGLSAFLSAWGHPVLFVAAVLALVSLRDRRLALQLAVPAVMPGTQIHYHLFSAEAVKRSVILFAALAVELPYVAPLGIIACAIVARRRDERTVGLDAARPKVASVGPGGRGDPLPAGRLAGLARRVAGRAG